MDPKEGRSQRDVRRQGRGKRDPWSSGSDRRTHLRFQISNSEQWINTMPSYGLIDMSGSGMGLKSRYPVRTGEMVRVSLAGGPSADALVVYCRLGGLPDRQLIPEFHLGCRFLSRKEADALNEKIEFQLACMMG